MPEAAIQTEQPKATELRHELDEEQNQIFAVLHNKVMAAQAEVHLAEQQFAAKKEKFQAISEDADLFLVYIVRAAKLEPAEGGYSPTEYSAGKFALTGKAKAEQPPANPDTNKE